MADIQFGLKLSADGSSLVSGVKSSKAAVDELSASATSASLGFRGLSDAANFMVGALHGAVAAFSVGAVIAWSKSVVSAAADLNDLAQMTGSTVESLSRLSNQFAISGKGTGELNIALQRLSVNLNGTDEESGRAQKRLAQLGITTKDPAQAFEQLARVLENYQDGVGKAAAVQDILGRGSQALIPVLHDLASAGSTHATVTQEQADQAEKLQKALAKISAESTLLKDALLNNIVAPLNEAIDRFKVAKELYGGGFFGTLFSVNAAAAGGSDFYGQALKSANKELEDAKKNITDYARLGGQANEIDKAGVAILESKVALLKQAVVQQGLALISPRNADQNDRRYNIGGDLRPELNPLPGKTGAAKSEVDEFAKAIGQLNKLSADADLEFDQLFRTERITKAEKALAEFTASDRWSKLSATEKEVITDFAEVIKHTEQATEKAKESTKGWEQYEAAMRKVTDAETAQIFASQKHFEQTIEKLGEETAVVGLSSRERERYIALQRIETDNNAGLIGSYDEYIARINKVNAAFNGLESAEAGDAFNKARLKMIDDQVAAYERGSQQIGDDLSNAVLDGIEHGGKSALDDLKRMFSQLVLRPIIQGVLAPVTGALASSLYGGQAFGSTGNALGTVGQLGNLYGAASGFGLTGASGAGGFVAGLTGGTTGAFSAAGAGAEAAVGFGTEFGAAGAGAAGAGIAAAALPIVGWAIAAYSLYKALASKGGGPKKGGSYDTGDVLNGQRFFDPSDADADLKQRALALKSGYNTNLAALGGRGVGNFALAYDSDPDGTASDRVSTGATVNGKRVYFNRDENTGRDSAATQAELATQADRALLAALQASELPQDVAKILNSVVASTGTDQQIQDIIARAELYKTLGDYANTGDDALKAYALSQQSVTQNLDDQRTAVEDLASSYDGSTASTLALANATSAYHAAAVQAVIAIKQIEKALHDAFDQTRETIEFAGLTPEQRFALDQQKADNAYAQALASNDPAEVQRLTDKINGYINDAFSQLTPDQQIAQRADFLSHVDTVDATIGHHLDDIGTSITNNVDATFADVRGVLADVGTVMTSAADKTDGAADKLVGVANSMTGSAVVISAAAERIANTVLTLNIQGGNLSPVGQ